MRALVRAMIGNPVGANLIFLAVLAVGGVALFGLPREVFPDFARQGAEVQVVFPNASPEEVERLAVIPIEEAADGVQGTEEIHSISQQDWARILIKIREGTQLSEYLDELRMEVDAIRDWPKDAERPRILEQRIEFPVITVNLFGRVEEETVRKVADRLREKLRAVPGVASVRLFGVRRPEIRVEIPQERLERYGTTRAQIAAALGLSLRNLPGGTLETRAGEVRLRILGEETDPERIARRVVRALPDGSLLRVGDLGRVSLGHERARTLSRYDGYPSASLSLAKDPDADIIRLVAEVKELVAAERPQLPEGLGLGVSSDFSIYVRNRLRTLLQSGMFGLALVLLLLWGFLEARIALMTALGIPVAVLGGALCMGLLGITMNMLSMFAFILVLGMIVDDAIVVVENAYRYVEAGMRPRDAALRGTLEVAWPVVTTVTTTIAAFGAMLMIQGELGKWMEPVPWVAGLTLLASLGEALLVLPSHFAEWMPEPDGKGVAVSRLSRRASGRWYDGLHRFYERSLRIALRHRYAVLLGALSLMLWAWAFFDSGHLKFVLMPKFEAKLFMVDFETPPESSLAQTSAVLGEVERVVGSLPPEELESYVGLAGATYADQTNYRSGRNLGQVFVELAEGGERRRSTAEIQDDLRHRLRGIPGLNRLEFDEPQAGPIGSDIELRLKGGDERKRVAAAAEVVAYLGGFPGVVDLRDDRQPGPREYRLSVSDEGRILGFDESRLAQAVLGAFHGDKARILRLERDPADLLVRLPERARHGFQGLRDLRVTSPTGASLPLSRVADLRERRGFAQVIRRDRARAVTISADVTEAGNPREILQRLFAHFSDLTTRYPGVELAIGGDKAETVKSMASLGRAIVISFVVIYFLLAFLFRSYVQPLVVLLSVPFAALGVVFGFTVIGEPLSFMTLLGMLALAGVAVNDALVLVDFINQHRRAGHGLGVAVLRAGEVRMRPVLITTLTTLGGLFPLAFFSSGQARFLAPMAQALIFGMISATAMTLILVPVGYLVIADLERGFNRLFRRGV